MSGFREDRPFIVSVYISASKLCCLPELLMNLYMYIIFLSFLSGNIRNLAMEKVASSVQFPCKYCSSGCTVTLPHTEKPDHEETCEYR